MFDSVDFQNVSLVIQHTGKTILSDTQFVEGSACEWFEVIRGFTPLGVNYFV